MNALNTKVPPSRSFEEAEKLVGTVRDEHPEVEYHFNAGGTGTQRWITLVLICEDDSVAEKRHQLQKLVDHWYPR